nr:DUF1629 domain-containing protein [uncultured Dokdonia sp.]
MVSENFKNFIEELKIQDVLFLPIQIEKDKKKINSFILKFSKSKDCIDYDKSDLVEIQGLIRKINSLKLRNDFNEMFFQCQGLKLRIIINDIMKSKIENSDLKKLKFNPLP